LFAPQLSWLALVKGHPAEMAPPTPELAKKKKKKTSKLSKTTEAPVAAAAVVDDAGPAKKKKKTKKRSTDGKVKVAETSTPPATKSATKPAVPLNRGIVTISLPDGVAPPKEAKAEMAVPVIGKELPPVPAGLKPDDVTIVLFYQYVEPMWSKNAHKTALKMVNQLCRENNIFGRGRCAREGLNCTLSSSAENIRKFCLGLRAWSKVFNETDFKFTDGLPSVSGFKSLSIRKTNELVAYGLEDAKAPSLKSHQGDHLDALEFHNMLEDKKGPETVVIDVRNYYESVVGHFQPPKDSKVEFLDPKMRNSHDFPCWLNMPETQEKLKDKRVMMYCTGGIRCERASALINQMTEVMPEFKTKGVYELRGGVERYMRTFPEGGHWKGKNYVFDKRRVQVPETKDEQKLQEDLQSLANDKRAVCAVCETVWDEYRGKNSCGVLECGVPVIVCPQCLKDLDLGTVKKESLRCPLCKEGYVAPTKKPDLLGQKLLLAGGDKKRKREAENVEGATRLFVGKIPLTVTAAELEAALCQKTAPEGAQKSLNGNATCIQWIGDKTSGLFYGSCFVEMKTHELAAASVEAAEQKKVSLKGRNLKVSFSPPKEGDVWPPAGHVALDRPKIF
jgi:predicted sulfurtransferase